MYRLLLIPGAVLVLLAGAMMWSGGGVEKRAEFTFINRGDIYTLDLNQMSYMQDFRLTYGIREGLYSPDPATYRPIPAGAVDHHLSDDKRVWTFRLRPGARWSNGDPVTARDYVFSWRRMLEEPGEYTYLFYYIRNAQKYEQSVAAGEPIDWKDVGIEAPDDLTFRVTLNDPVPYLLELLAFPPFYPRHEPSMRPFRSFVEIKVFDRLNDYVAAANRVDAAAAPQAMAPAFAKAVGRDPASLDAAAVAAFVGRAKSFDASRAELSQVLDVLQAAAALRPFDERTEADQAATLKQMAARRFARYTYRADYTRPPHVVTNGPYLLTRWDFKRRLILEKSPTYWDRDNVKTPKIEMAVNDNPLNQFLLYESGAVDWMADVPGDLAAELKAKGRPDLRASPAFGTAFLTILCRPELPAKAGGGKNPLADVRVRQALAMSIDKRFVVDNLTRMGELPARTYLPPDGTLPDFRWLPGPYDTSRKADAPYTPEEVRALLARGPGGDGPGLPYDVARARQLLAEAGYPGGQGFRTLPVLFNTDSPVRVKIAQVLKSQWKQALNIDVDVQGIEGKVFRDRVSKKEYAIATVAWYGDYPDASTFTDKYKSTSLQNDSDWQNKAFDELCEAAAKEGDVAVRNRIMSRAEHMIDTEVPIIPMYHYVNVSLYRDAVHGVQPNPRNMTIFKGVSVSR